MIYIVPKPTDTHDDNSTATVAMEIRKQGGKYLLLDINRIDPFTLPFEHELVWVCGLTQDEHQFEVLQALSLSNVLVNTPQAIGTCASKVLTTALLLRHAIPSPRTLFTNSKEHAGRFIKEQGKVVIKPVYGFDGHGIFLIDSPDQLGKPPYYLQEYVQNDRDFRIFVIDGEPVGAIMRISNTLAHNIHQGGIGTACEIDEEMRSIAGAAARVAGVDYGGVDLLRYADSYCVLEVNGTPNWHCMSAPIPAFLARYLLEKERSLSS
ncbi:MAG: ATP-grasp domain-containing protein [Methanoregulaceae archaeon]|jgi:ribosomal protein S6--L-glutamate ligase|nr:ATP-grasp domain-containing protein [Methanoregulaceae archaeon]MCU0628236.1 ATP-grasp domain-containing protein [Methanoregulaceae archaeon]